jgi:UDP-GlcNAc:undecaprenyl-phosphate/decaprenyl-phosphate GlcNAc-1-phosphate transferase
VSPGWGQLVVAFVGLAAATLTLPVALRARPARLRRTNVSGRHVHAVLGLPLGAAGVSAALVAALVVPEIAPACLVAAALILVLGAAGLADDLRGAETARGFKGHLSAAASGRATGGVIKLAAGAVAGLLAGVVLFDGPMVVVAALLVALSANLVNLLDRAPGRAGKVTLAGGVALVVLGPPQVGLALAGAVAATALCLPFDLSERAMLGDAGANAVGAVLGLGLALSLPPVAGAAAVVVLAALNLASERWSFSELIERVGFLRTLDRLGRVPRRGGK